MKLQSLAVSRGPQLTRGDSLILLLPLVPGTGVELTGCGDGGDDSEDRGEGDKDGVEGEDPLVRPTSDANEAEIPRFVAAFSTSSSWTKVRSSVTSSSSRSSVDMLNNSTPNIDP